MDDRVTGNPPNVAQEYWEEIRFEFGEQNGVYCLIADFASWIAATIGLWYFCGVLPEKTVAVGVGANILGLFIGFPWLMWKSHSNITERYRENIFELEKGLRSAQNLESLSTVEGFQDWVVEKSSELLEIKTEIQFWRWKESVSKAIVASIKPEFQWNDTFASSYEGDGILFSSRLIAEYERAMEGMRRSITPDHFTGNVPSHTSLGKFRAWVNERIRGLETVVRARDGENVGKDCVPRAKTWKKDTGIGIAKAFGHGSDQGDDFEKGTHLVFPRLPDLTAYLLYESNPTSRDEFNGKWVTGHKAYLEHLRDTTVPSQFHTAFHPDDL